METLMDQLVQETELYDLHLHIYLLIFNASWGSIEMCNQCVEAITINNDYIIALDDRLETCAH